MQTELIDEMLKSAMSGYFEEVADSADCDLQHLFDLIIEMMQEDGYLPYDIQRVVH